MLGFFGSPTYRMGYISPMKFEQNWFVAQVKKSHDKRVKMYELSGQGQLAGMAASPQYPNVCHYKEEHKDSATIDYPESLANIRG